MNKYIYAMKYAFFILTMVLSLNVFSQNVGINKTNPNYPLDINGDLNVDGKILINGNSGQSGQVLTTNSAGSTFWSNQGEFKYMVSYTQNGNWPVPGDVDHIRIEIWGAGGGGAGGGGGAAGMYMVSLVDVTPGSTITITRGNGGAYGTTTYSGNNGTSTVVSGSFGTLTALGGGGASTVVPGNASTWGAGGLNYFQFQGQGGLGNSVSYQQKNSTTYAIVKKYGDGGASGPDYLRRCQGKTVITNENTGLAIDLNHTAFAPFPGGGGGGGTTGRTGANGMVVIWY